MTRRDFISAAGAGAAPSAFRPNVILILTDQQSAGAYSAAGNPWLKTPAIDSLAADGVSFPDACCTYPVCSPSRSSIFTGRMPHETGVRGNGGAIAPGIPTLGEVFRQAGYATAYAGKWHLPRSFGGDVRGFEYLAGGHRLGRQMDEPLAAASSKWLGERREGPFLLAVSFMNPHDICDWIRMHPGTHSYPGSHRFPPAPANMAVDPNEPEAVQYHRRAGYDLMSQAVGIASEWRREDVRHYLHAYGRLVEEVDRAIGDVLAAVRKRGLERDTVIVFTSDHGEGLGAHRWVQKAAFWEEVIRVPLIFAGWGVAQRGTVADRCPVSLADLVPTLCDLAGIRVPDSVRGVSLRPVLQGWTIDRPFVVSELRYGDETREGRALRGTRYKYVQFNWGSRREQLFDLELDPGETLNLASRPGAATALEEHRALLRGWVRSTADDFATL